VAALAGSARAQAYPTRPIEMIVPLSPGGSVDLLARLISVPLSATLGQPVSVVNQPGASSVIGTRRVATARPDGYTLLTCSPAFTVLASKPDIPFDVLKDFAPVTRIATATYYLVVNPELLPVKDMAGLIKMVTDAPAGTYLYASGGVGTSPHLAMEYLNSLTGMKTTHVPYTGGGGPGVQATVDGQVQLTFASPAAASQAIADGKLNLIGIGSTKRSSLSPDIPTIAEQGVPDFEYEFWSAVLAPAATPAEIISMLHDGIAQAVKDPTVVDRYKTLGYEASLTSPEELQAFLERDAARWKKVIEEAKISME
jgi:tripartite-type tricarboxylate transporter receptor subunit TctC